MKFVGRYAIRGLLGQGGMGRVYRVELPPVGKIGALKLFDPDPLLARLMGRDKLRELFVNEAATIAALSHPHLVTIHDFDVADGAPFFVMDYIADNLGAVIGEHFEVEHPTRTVSVDRALDYTRQILQGLACLHDAGIVHRDIKPYNLLLTPWDTIQICDFGLSRVRGEVFQGPANLNVGSPYYAAPEQEADPDHVGPPADLYAVGVVLYRMLSGRLPLSTEDYSPLEVFNADLDAPWDAWMQHAMAVRPRDRFASAEAMGQALDALAAHWDAQKERACAVPVDRPRTPATFPASVTPRSTPIKAPPRQAIALFKLDSLWRPERYATRAFTTSSDDIVIDQAAGLAWQRAGSPFPRTWQQSGRYVQRLNDRCLAGCTAWRLPTIDELLTLLRPPAMAMDLCVPAVFAADQCRLWSADRRSYAAAYYVDSEMGYVGWQDFSALFHVRGVCALSEVKRS